MAQVLIETSARHVHLTKEHIEILFGAGHELTHKKDLSQPGQFACEERVTVVGPKKELAGVSILGPCRPATQVEISLTDARSIGLPIVIRESGQLEATPGCKLVGPCGEIEIEKGVIAWFGRVAHWPGRRVRLLGFASIEGTPRGGHTVCVD